MFPLLFQQKIDRAIWYPEENVIPKDSVLTPASKNSYSLVHSCKIWRDAIL